MEAKVGEGQRQRCALKFKRDGGAVKAVLCGIMVEVDE